MDQTTLRALSHTGVMEFIVPPLGTVTTDLAALNCGVRPATIRDWVRRGLLTRCGGTPRRPLYRLADVEAARYAAKPSRTGQRAA
ncbi:hypothetical protein ACIG63_27165 [Streptomyces antimycoticus]|uniref:hypothetical protein n=1 Tax=Streptomyces antimycoticus TaxID=68175 RepID=UPI0037D8A244